MWCGSVFLLVAGDVEALGIVEDLRIAIRGGRQCDHLGVVRDHIVAKLCIRMKHTHSCGDGSRVAKTLFDRALDQLWMSAKLLIFVGMTDQRRQAVADQADCRLEAGDQKADRLRIQFDFGESFTVLLGRDER